MKKNILITGVPGIGKTRLVRKVISMLGAERPAAGFYTEEIREGGVRKGFRVKTLAGKEGILAHSEVRSPYRVGKYGVEIEQFEAVAIPAIKSGVESEASLIVIDEIGKMECFSKAFKQIVVETLDSNKRVLATIALKGNGFMNSIRNRADISLIQITEANRDKIPDELAAELMRKSSSQHV